MAGQKKVKLPKYVNGFFDQRLGRARYILRVPGQKTVTLPGLLWSPQMMATIEAALAGQPLPMPGAVAIGASRTLPGTLNEAIVKFYDSSTFTQLGRAHQMRHRQVLEKFRQVKTADNVTRGERALHTLTYDRLSKMLAEIESPNGQRHLLNGLRALLKFAKATQLIAIDPCDGLKAKRRPKTGGFKVWEEEDIAKYRAHHALGTMPRLALEIMLNTGLRRSDAHRLGRQHVRDGVLTITPQKTSTVTGVTVVMPMHPDLVEAIASMPPVTVQPTPLTYLLTSHGKAFTVAGFGKWFGEQCKAAGCDVRAHGLRKAICRRLVRVGMTPHQIAAITGHTDLREIELYAREFDREQAARQAMAGLMPGRKKNRNLHT